MVLEDPGALNTPSSRRRPLVALAGHCWPAAAAAGAALFVGGWLAKPAPRTHSAEVRKVNLAIGDLDANLGRQPPPISPDGSRVAFVAGGRLRVRRLDSLDATELADGDDVGYMSWSPDSRHLAYVRRGRAWKVSTGGGQPTALGPVPGDLVGSAGSVWTSDGQVVFAGSDTVGLWTVSADGGSARELLAVDRSAEADFHEIGRAAAGPRADLHRAPQEQAFPT